MFLLKRHTSGCSLNIFFDLVLTCAVTAPHSFYEAWFVNNSIFEFFIVCSNISMGISVLTCTLQHIFLDCFQDFLYFLHKLIKCNSIFLSCITTANDSLTILDILRAALDTNRNTTHFLLCEFESRALVCVVYFYADSCCF